MCHVGNNSNSSSSWIMRSGVCEGEKYLARL